MIKSYRRVSANRAIQSDPKPFFGYSDNTHFANFLWLAGIPSYYSSSLHTQFALNGRMDLFTVGYIKKALFESGEVELTSSEMFNDIGLDWNDPLNMTKELAYEKNDGWFWDGEGRIAGRTWGGCLESMDEMLRHGSHILNWANLKISSSSRKLAKRYHRQAMCSECIAPLVKEASSSGESRAGGQAEIVGIRQTDESRRTKGISQGATRDDHPSCPHV